MEAMENWKSALCLNKRTYESQGRNILKWWGDLTNPNWRRVWQVQLASITRSQRCENTPWSEKYIWRLSITFVLTNTVLKYIQQDYQFRITKVMLMSSCHLPAITITSLKHDTKQKTHNIFTLRSLTLKRLPFKHCLFWSKHLFGTCLKKNHQQQQFNWI